MSLGRGGSVKKSERVSLLLTPQMAQDLTTLAQIKRVSVNDLFTTLAAQAISKNREAIDSVKAVMEKVLPGLDL